MPVAPTLPISRLIDLDVILTPGGAQFANFSAALVLGSSAVIDTNSRIRQYDDLDEVAIDFGEDAPEYEAADFWFAQQPTPTSLVIGRWAQTAAAGQLIGGTLSAANSALATWTAISAGGFTVTTNGGSPTQIGPLDFSGVVSLNGVAAIIATAMTALNTGCVYDFTYNRFEFTSTTTGTTSAVSFLSAPDGITDISGTLGGTAATGAYDAPGIAAESAISAVTLIDESWGGLFYGLAVLGASDADHLAVAAYIEGAANPVHYYGITTQEAASLNPIGVDTTSLMYQLSVLNYDRTAIQYSGNTPYAILSLLARILTTNWNNENSAITLMYKQEPGVVAENLNPNQIGAIEAKNGNAFVAYNNNTAIIERGTSCSGEFIDTVIGIDWLANQIQTDVFNILYTTPTKIPQTDPGMGTLGNGIAQACQAGINNGLLAPGTWNSQGFGQLVQGGLVKLGYYIYIPPVAGQAESQRAARISVPYQVAAKLAGAVHDVQITLYVNQ